MCASNKKKCGVGAAQFVGFVAGLQMDLQGVWSIEHDLRYAEGKIMALENVVAKLEAKVAKLETAVANGGKMVASDDERDKRTFNALYDVHGC